MTAVLLANCQSEIKNVTTDLVKAKEEGNTKEEVELQQRLNDLQAQRRDLERAKTELDGRVKNFDDRAKEERAKVSVARVPEKAQQWMGKNRWFNNARFQAETLLARQIDRELTAKGLNMNTDAYYRELDAEIRKRMPELTGKVAKVLGRPAAAGGGNRTAVAAPTRSSSGQTAVRTGAPKKVVLNAEDFQRMREFKLDPNNQAHRVEWARNKLGLNG